MLNPLRWAASISAARAVEATEIVMDQAKLAYQFIDSKEWQKAMLPSGLEGDQLKLASFQVGQRLFPGVNVKKDADALLMAEYARRKGL